MVNPILGCFICDEKHCGRMTQPLNWHTFTLPVRICSHNAEGATVQASFALGHARAAQASLISGWGPVTPRLVLSLYFVISPVVCLRLSWLQSVQSGSLEVSSLSTDVCGPKGCSVSLCSSSSSPCRQQSLSCMLEAQGQCLVSPSNLLW